MKLAEALIVKADLQGKLNYLSSRLYNNALIAEGEIPAENPTELIKETENTVKEIIRITALINLTNVKAKWEGKSITELLAEREYRKKEISILRSFLDEASMIGSRTRGSEIKIISTVPVKEIQKNLDGKSAELRKLDIKIQELNWTTDLIEE